MKKDELELLAPAGSLDTLKAVIHAGADAVYLGGSMFGARAYAANFTEEELCEGIDYAHLHGRKVFLTVNTLLKNREITEELEKYLQPYYECGLDAVIVQDFGVLNFIKEHFPGLHLHASTQMTVTGADGAAFLKELGVSRVVTARELSLQEIRHIYDVTGMEIESFIHGALCYSYSGQCLMSSMLGGRSGNRGRCAGTCRLPFSVKGQKDIYPLSLKDLCTIDQIPYLAENGIYSFKIEGRMKSAEYAAGVVSVYRKYMDLYLKNGRDGFKVEQADFNRLLALGNRSGFTGGYYNLHNDKDMVTYEKPGHSKSSDELLQEIAGKYLKPEKKMKITGRLLLKEGKPSRLTVSNGKITVTGTGETVQTAKNRPMTKENIEEKMKKTGDTPFVFEELSTQMSEAVFLPVQKLNELRRETLAQLKETLLSEYRRTADTGVKADGCDTRNDCMTTGELSAADVTAGGSIEAASPVLTVSVMTEEQLSHVLSFAEVKKVCLDSGMFLRKDLLTEAKKAVSRVKSAGKECFFVLPYIFRQNTAEYYEDIWEDLMAIGFDGLVVKSYDEIGFLKRHKYELSNVLADWNLYTFSDLAERSFEKQGIIKNTAPLELNQKELMHRDNHASELLIYGSVPLMVTANCIHKNFGQCDKKRQFETLTDRYGKEFMVWNNCNECLNLIYNPDCLNLFAQRNYLKKMNFMSYRISFTYEPGEKAEAVMREYQRIFTKQGEPVNRLNGDFYTNGHFKRGVE